MFVSQKKYNELYEKWRTELYRAEDLNNELINIKEKHEELREAYDLVIKGDYDAVLAKIEAKRAANLNMYNAQLALYNAQNQRSSLLGIGR